MLSRLRRVMHPDAYHGDRAGPPFFEGWYFKLVDANRDERLAIIPGICKTMSRYDAHAFVQVFDGKAGNSWYARVPARRFSAAEGRFEVAVGDSRFSRERVELALSSRELTLRGELRLGEGAPWPRTALKPGIMGPFAWVPFMECYHGLLSFDHAVEGELELNGRRIDFTGGRGYIEKDWGRNFPKTWVWLQCNHFERPGVSLSASIALIPNLGRVFPGFIVGLWMDGQLHAFTTYERSTVDALRLDGDRLRWVLSNRSHRLELEVQRGATTPLPAPTLDGMERIVHETLSAKVDLRLLSRADESLVYEDHGECAGLEIEGAIDELAPR